MYTTPWCGDCFRSKMFFDQHKIDYLEVDITQNPKAAEFVQNTNHGMQSVPTIVFPNGKILVEPSNQELAETLLDE